jgi:molybdopterin synthase sulfur carrier subunit
MARITVVVKLFAVYQEVLGLEEIQLCFPNHTPVAEILEQLLQIHPELKPWQNLTRFGVNLQLVSPETLLRDGDEVVLIPPVSGG